MAAIQLGFTLRTSPNCKTVHLLGSWDGYQGQLPLSKDSSKSGAWKGTFKFQGASLQQGQRYWYYYIMDGHHVSHDPAQKSTVEPTTGRELNILDIPRSSSSKSSSSSSSRQSSSKASRSSGSYSSSKRSSHRYSTEVPKGRALSPSKIVSPRPEKPYATRAITSSDVDQLSYKLSKTQVSSSSFESDSDFDSSDSDIDSDASSNMPSLSSGSSSPRSPASSLSSGSSRGSPVCGCDRWGQTRQGGRIHLDCGGAKCGFSSDSASDSEDGRQYRTKITQPGNRQGIVLRAPKPRR